MWNQVKITLSHDTAQLTHVYIHIHIYILSTRKLTVIPGFSPVVQYPSFPYVYKTGSTGVIWLYVENRVQTGYCSCVIVYLIHLDSLSSNCHRMDCNSHQNLCRVPWRSTPHRTSRGPMSFFGYDSRCHGPPKRVDSEAGWLGPLTLKMGQILSSSSSGFSSHLWPTWLPRLMLPNFDDTVSRCRTLQETACVLLVELSCVCLSKSTQICDHA